MVPLDSVALMFPPVKREFASLTETLTTSIYATDIRLLIRVDAFMLLPVLVESKPLVTVSTLVLLHIRVDQVVPSKREFGGKHRFALLTLINSLGLHLNY